MRSPIGIMLLALLLTGCTRTVANPFPVVRTHDDDGRVRSHDLRADLGVLLDWPSEQPEPRGLHLFDRVHDRRASTRDPAVFLDWLRQLPRGSEVCWIQRCGSGFSSGAPDEFLPRLQAVAADRDLRWIPPNDERSLIICVCETQRTEIVTTPNASPDSR